MQHKSGLELRSHFGAASSLARRESFGKFKEVAKLPHLIETQLISYNWFMREGLKNLLAEISPIYDWTGEEFKLEFLDYYLDEPKYDEYTSKQRNVSYEAALRCNVKLTNLKTKKEREQEIFLTDFPIITSRATLVVNGVERVVISQLIRSAGALFYMQEGKEAKLFGAKIIPNRGAWLEIETESDGSIMVKIDRKRKVAVTSLLRAFGYSTDEEILNLFKDTDTGDFKYIIQTLSKDVAKSQADGFIEVYKRIRPGDLATADNAKQMIEGMFFNSDRYDFGSIGRYKLKQRLGIKTDVKTLRGEDVVEVIKEIIRLNNNPKAEPDDIDHLGNRRVRTIGELIQNKMRQGFMRIERIIKDKMSTLDVDFVTPSQLINSRPLVAVVKEFFSSSQLSQFMDQVNPLAELEHKRRLSALGPGGLVRERAGFDVRDVHPSHYGKICPIQTPEGPNIGLINHLACYAKINEYGFLETPYRKVKKGKASKEIIYLDAMEEESAVIAHAGGELDKEGRFINKKVEVRIKGRPTVVERNEVDYMDVSAKQCISVATSLIPFLEHDNANRALMGSNMQRQAVSCICPQSPLIGTGLEDKAAADSGQIMFAEADGEVKEVDADHIKIKLDTSKGKSEIKNYSLQKFARSNVDTCMNQHVRVQKGQKIKAGSLLVDGAATEKGELALGQNILVAFMPFDGANFEDAIVISENLLKDDRYSSIHIEDHAIEIRDTKLGPEIITRDIPNVGEERLKNLDEEGVIRVGAEVKSGDILVGKISPKGETDLTAEERLLRAIFGEKARDVKDTSLLLPHGDRGKVIEIKEFSRDKGDKLGPGVIKVIQVRIATLRKISVGDKLAGRHGNKGIIAKILPEEDMPFLPDGTPIEMILNPLGVASRMNLGQIFEMHLGWAAERLGYKVASPALNGISEDTIKEELKKAGLPENGKVILYDGRTGEPFAQKISVGFMYMLKLFHLVEDKIHMRSIGPYSLITQQPLGGKAQFGGQRFGEMEVWALEGYGVSHVLQEMLTIKSDDVFGRSKAYDSIIKGEDIKQPNIPASFHVLVSELKALALNVEMMDVKTVKEE